MEHGANHNSKSSYRKLALLLTFNFAIMYLVMYTMIASLAHLRLNLNNAYMTLMMAAPMAILMLIAMRSMFPSRPANLVLVVGAAAILIASFYAMRSQGLIGDEQFLRSMIPHHSGAILMCERSAITDPEIVALCDEIVRSQREEITQMEAILERY